MRRILVLPVLLGALLAAQPALAAGFVQRPSEPNSLSTAHFTVFFNSDPAPTAKDYITQTQAGDLAAMAERALSAETSWGFQAPVDDSAVPNGRIDIYVVDGTASPGVAGMAIADLASAPSSGSIDIAKTTIGDTYEQHVIAHELFHLIQFRTWVPSAVSDTWLFEGSAEWAGFKVDGYANLETLGPPDVSLDCRAAGSSQQACSPTSYVDGGYSRWPFFEYVAQRFGSTFVNGALAQGAGGATAINALAAAVTAKGGTLGDVFGDWVNLQMAGGYGIGVLDSATPQTAAKISTGGATADLSPTRVSVDHLATRFIELDRGTGDSTAPCFAAQLTITVAIPSGVSARPFLWWNAKGSALQPLTVTGSNASITVPWDTCTWTGNHALLSLPNPSTSVNGANFTVTMHLAVDTATPAGAVTPPSPVSVPGTVVDVPTVDVAPQIELFGPELIKVSEASRAIRLIVQSSGEGSLRATLGAFALGTGSLRPGNNDLRFVVPKSLVAALRTSAAKANVLTLTPSSTSGAVLGTPVTRVVHIARPSRHK